MTKGEISTNPIDNPRQQHIKTMAIAVTSYLLQSLCLMIEAKVTVQAYKSSLSFKAGWMYQTARVEFLTRGAVCNGGCVWNSLLVLLCVMESACVWNSLLVALTVVDDKNCQ